MRVHLRKQRFRIAYVLGDSLCDGVNWNGRSGFDDQLQRFERCACVARVGRRFAEHRVEVMTDPAASKLTRVQTLELDKSFE